MRAITLTVNGQATTAEIEPRTNLADFLREHLALTGTHVGCEHGVCGACTVLIDGAPARSCITFTASCDGAEVTTIEGLDSDSTARALREQFSVHHGLQCGYCTPGMLVTSRDIVLRIPDADERRIREELSGNLCRCTGYVGIVKAIKAVIAARDDNGKSLPDRTFGPVGAGHLPAEPAHSRAPQGVPRQEAPRWAAKAPALSSEDWRAVEEQGTELTESFTIAHPRNQIWAFFSDPQALAHCMPGATLTDDGGDGTLNGEIVVKLGPIVAAFAGVAEMERDDAAYRGVVRGHGRDQKSSSRARGVVSYELTEQGPQSTRVDVRVKFLLAGTLAQFSRTGLVHDIANQVTTVFARNLEARLSGEESADEAAAPLDAGNLAWKAMWARLKAAVGRLWGASKN